MCKTYHNEFKPSMQCYYHPLNFYFYEKALNCSTTYSCFSKVMWIIINMKYLATLISPYHCLRVTRCAHPCSSRQESRMQLGAKCYNIVNEFDIPVILNKM